MKEINSATAQTINNGVPGMPQTQAIADELFDGVINDEVIEYILYHYEYDELDEYVDEWDQKTAKIAYKIIKRKAKENVRAKRKAAGPNPYVKPLIIKTLVLTALIFIVLFGASMLYDMFPWIKDVTYSVMSVVIGLFSLSIADSIVRAVRFPNE